MKLPKKDSKATRIGTDIAGIACLMLVPFIGWIPGPGGIPLLLTGLGLLAINHEFARNWLNYVKRNSESLQKVVFPDIKWLQWAWDSFCIILLFSGLWLSFNASHILLKSLSFSFMFAATTIFMLNRNRLDRLDRRIRRLK